MCIFYLHNKRYVISMKQSHFIVIVLFGSPVPPASDYGRTCTCSTERKKSKREERGKHCSCISRSGWGGGQDPNKTTAKKRGLYPLLYHLCGTNYTAQNIFFIAYWSTHYFYVVFNKNYNIYKNLFSYTVNHRTMVVYTSMSHEIFFFAHWCSSPNRKKTFSMMKCIHF